MAGKGPLLTFEWDPDDETLEVHGNQEGFRKLASLLSELATKTQPDHYHLMTPDWGGEALSADQQNMKASLVHHVKILLWPDSPNRNQEKL